MEHVINAEESGQVVSIMLWPKVSCIEICKLRIDGDYNKNIGSRYKWAIYPPALKVLNNVLFIIQMPSFAAGQAI